MRLIKGGLINASANSFDSCQGAQLRQVDIGLNFLIFVNFLIAKANSSLAQIVELFLDRVENIVGKGENAGWLHFLILLLCFQQASFKGFLTHSQTSPRFLHVCITSLLKTWW